MQIGSIGFGRKLLQREEHGLAKSSFFSLKGGPLNCFLYPCAELDGKTLTLKSKFPFMARALLRHDKGAAPTALLRPQM